MTATQINPIQYPKTLNSVEQVILKGIVADMKSEGKTLVSVNAFTEDNRTFCQVTWSEIKNPMPYNYHMTRFELVTKIEVVTTEVF